MPTEMDEVIGAYEAWVSGVGAPHVFATPELRDSPYVAGCAVLPAGQRPPATVTGRRGAAARRLMLPALWRGGAAGGEAGFWPLIAERTPGRRGRTGAAPSATEFGLRLGMPLPAGAVDPGHDPQRIDARIARETPARPKVVMAVIEDGIAFAHRGLRTQDGRRTRVAFCWLQSAALAAQPDQRTVLFGREFLAGDIDALLGQAGGDEDLAYGLAGARSEAAYPWTTLDRRGSHGAHVLGLAAGLGAENVDDMAIIAVQLPEPLTLDTAGVGKEAFVLSALHYIFDRTDRLAAAHGLDRLPLVVNFSYGFTGGPHGGRDRLERAIAALVRQRAAEQPTHLVMPSGNTFHAKLYGEISDAMLAARGAGADVFTIPWRIQPNDRTSNYLEIWLPEAASPAGLAVDVALPDGAGWRGAFAPGAPAALTRRALASAGHEVGEIAIERFGVGEGRFLWRLLVSIAPTEPPDPAAPAAPCGLALVRLTGLAGILAHGPVCCRIQRDTDPFGYARGARQSYFDDPFDVAIGHGGAVTGEENPATAFVRRFGTLNGLATHDAVTVVGGLEIAAFRPSFYASAPAPHAPDVPFSAPSDVGPALRGVPGAGTRSGAVIRMDGTSVAAPQVARAIAEAYLASPALAQAPVPTGDVARILAARVESAAAASARPEPDRRRLGRALL